MNVASEVRCFAGTQYVYEHESAELAGSTRIGVYVPDNATVGAATLVWLSGLTCTEDNFVSKAGAQRLASELGMIIVAPDTSPRGDGVPDDPDGAWDFGLGAGFYVDATQAPWSAHYRMRSFVEKELLPAVGSKHEVDLDRVGISGHSMGGHGALTLGIRNPEQFRSISAFAPICSPMNCPWGHKALGGYLGSDLQAHRDYDACALIEDRGYNGSLLVDQGAVDSFLTEQLLPERLERVCAEASVDLQLNRRAGYDHSYYFIQSFIDDHLRWHAAQLAR